MSGTRWIFAMVATLSVAAAACADAPTGGSSGPGTLILRLATPHADDGAMAFEVSGPSIDTATAVNASLRLFTRRTDSSTMVGVVVGSVAAGALITLRVRDVGAAASYTARVVEVADRHNGLRASLTGYGMIVAP